MQNMPRRTFLKSTGTAAAVTLLSHGALSAQPPETAAAATETGEQDHILFASASALVEEMRNKRLSPVEAANAHWRTSKESTPSSVPLNTLRRSRR